MKRNLIFFLPFMLMLAASCTNGGNSTPTPLPSISGTYSGTFYKLKLKAGSTNAFDTAAKAQISLNINTTTGFAVTGDTATLHAGSKGDYQYNSQYIQFADNTYAPNTPQTKIHLNGVYGYAYDATNNRLQMEYDFTNDTLVYYYNLKK